MKKSIILFLMLSLFLSCNKDNTEDETPTPNPYVPETIMNGKVNLVNQFGDNLPEFEPINVSVNNQSHTVTSNTGEFELWDLQDNETYTLSFSSETVGELFIYDFTFNDGGTAETIYLSEKSDSKFTFIEFWPPTNYTIEIRLQGIMNYRPRDRYLRIYYDTVPEVSFNRYVFTRRDKYRAEEGLDSWTRVFHNEWDYKKYDTIYARVYGAAAEGSNYQTYIDPETGLMIDPGINDNESQSMFVACEIIDWKK